MKLLDEAEFDPSSMLTMADVMEITTWDYETVRQKVASSEFAKPYASRCGRWYWSKIAVFAWTGHASLMEDRFDESREA
ncbi:MAG: hypothetical protein ACR2PG_03115 [Hyphomicrobiaceae bacterium]